MTFDSGFKVYRKNNESPLVSSGDKTLDELLGGGGFHKNLSTKISPPSHGEIPEIEG